jgi:hypothetical protein
MNITRLSYTHRDLVTLSELHVSTLLLVGHFLNEANWLRKLILMATMDQSGSEPEEKARLALTLMLANVSAGKIHAGWMRIMSFEKEPTLAALFAKDKVKDLYARLAPLLAEGSLLHKFRNRQGSHYPTSLSLAQLPNIADDDVALFATPYDGDTLSLMSTLCAAGSLVHISGDQTVDEALGSVIDAVVKAFDIYCTLLLEILFSLLKNDIRAPGKQTVIANDGACKLSDIRLRFFCDPPSDESSEQAVTQQVSEQQV